MARHRAPDVASPPRAGHATGTARPRHAAGQGGVVGPRSRQFGEIVAWVGFACLVSCGVVASGQGPRAQAVWILGIAGILLTSAGLGVVVLERRRAKRDVELPQ